MVEIKREGMWCGGRFLAVRAWSGMCVRVGRREPRDFLRGVV